MGTTSVYFVFMLITYSKRVRINHVRLSILKQGKLMFPCLRSRLRRLSRETGSAVPSRVSLLISILRLNLVLSHRIPPDLRGGVHLFN